MTQKGAVVLLAVVAALAFAAPATAGPAGQPTADDPVGEQSAAAETAQAAQAAANNTSNATLGASVSAFMQASAVETEGEVDDGMFAAAFNRSEASERANLVTSRTDELQERLESLRQQRAELLEGGGNLTVAERARAASLTARIDALADSIGQAERAAEQAGVDSSELRELRTEARSLGGPEVAEMATDIATAGPPGDRGPPGEITGNVTESPGPDGNATESGPGNGSGSGDGDSGNGPPADGDGPPGAGDGSGDGQGNGPPDDPGNDSTDESTSDDSSDDGTDSTS
jgi:hypothetical protein